MPEKKIEEKIVIEWILVVWLVSCSPEGCDVAPGFEVGTYRQELDCEVARDSVSPRASENLTVGFVARCIERDKQ